MDDKLFKELLTQVADWRIPETITGTTSGDAKSPRGRGRPSAEESYQIQRERMFQEEFGGVNPTFPPQITKLKHQEKICEDCGQCCPEGRHIEKKRYTSAKKTSWRSRCVTCGLCQNPFTGQYDLSTAKASAVWADFLKDRKGAYKTPGNQAREAAGVIKIYPENFRSDK